MTDRLALSSQGEHMPNILTGGDWENRANEYWRNWHRSARIAGDEQMRRERAERDLRGAVDALRAIRARTDGPPDDDMLDDVVQIVDSVLYPARGAVSP